jgi:amidase
MMWGCLRVIRPGHHVIMAAWVGRTATEIAAAVRAGEVTTRSVVAEHLDRIAKINAELGAFVRPHA